MSRTPIMKNLKRAIILAMTSNKMDISTAEALERSEASRRHFLKGVGKIAGLASLATLVRPLSAMARPTPNIDVGIVGAGLAGLSCAYELKKWNVNATVYEAQTRLGGRCFSLYNFFPGQVAERGGELIDNHHKTMIGYAREFGLPLEDVNKNPGAITYYFNNQSYSESVVVEQFRAFVPAMQADMRLCSGEVTAYTYNNHDLILDNTNLEAYLNGANALGLVAGPVAKEAIRQAYIAEYGREPFEQSALNFLLFIHSDRRSKFTPFGVFSDERYHVTGGNDKIVQGLASRVSNQVQLDMKLVRIKKTSGGKVELTFKRGNTTIVKTHDAAVITVPFSVLRDVQLDANLGISPYKTNAIRTLGYGDNAKMMVGFDARVWSQQGKNGASYSDKSNVQTTWETNWTQASNTRAILTDYSGGVRAKSLNPNKAQQETQKFLSDLNSVFPGAYNSATLVQGKFRSHLEHWPSNPFIKGSYTCYLPGQFTTVCGTEGETESGNLFFAGEHANSFYEWQGFMEGACLSGIDAALGVLSR